MRMRVFIALLCCLMLSGCQHSASLPAADKVETEDMAERDTEKPADGKIIDFDGDGIEDAAALSIVDKDYAKLTVTRGRGKTLEEEIPGWWWFVDHETGRDSLEPADVPVCDFDGDGKDEMLMQLAFAGSSGPSREIHIFKVENDKLVELPLDYIFPDISDLPDKTDYLSQFKDINDNCLGAQIVRGDDDRPLLRVRQYDLATSNYDGSWYVDCAFTGQGWAVKRVTWSRVFPELDGNEHGGTMPTMVSQASHSAKASSNTIYARPSDAKSDAHLIYDGVSGRILATLVRLSDNEPALRFKDSGGKEVDIDIPCLPYDGVWLTADFADIDNDGVEEVIVQVDHNTTMGDKWVSVFDIKDGVPALELLIYSGWPFASQWGILPAGHTNDEWRELLIGSLRSNCAIMELYSIESASIMGEAAPHYITVYYRNADSEPTDDLRSLELYFD